MTLLLITICLNINQHGENTYWRFWDSNYLDLGVLLANVRRRAFLIVLRESA